MLIGLGQINTTVGDLAGNVSKILEFAQAARARGADLLLFPELSLSGYPPRDLVLNDGFLEANRKAVRELARHLPKGLTTVVGYASRSKSRTGKPSSNTVAVLRDGKILYEQAKMLLPTYDVFDEERNFEPGQRPRVVRWKGHRLAITICEDCWNDKQFWKHQIYPHDPLEELAKQRPTVLLNISASPYAMGKREIRRRMLRALARRYRVPVVMTNAVGGNDSLIFDGSSLALDSKGRICAQAKSFEEDLVVFDTAGQITDIHPQPKEEIDAVFRALVLGTRDYCRKCGFSEAVIGLSGGIDSSVVAVIASHALGPENVLGVGMPGPFSSEGSLRDARHLAQNLGIRFEVVPITGVYEGFRKELTALFQGLPLDVTEENLQARARGTVLMAISNKQNALVLSTGNKSELAVGYCTLYGDMVGGLAVISDVYKTKVYELARWINREKEVIPRPSLEKPPSAELRPDQTDQDSLPPYEVLDQILQDYVEDGRRPRDIARKRKLSRAVVDDVVRRVNRNEYKRQQAAPGLKVTPKAFGVGRVYPIAQCYYK